MKRRIDGEKEKVYKRRALIQSLTIEIFLLTAIEDSTEEQQRMSFLYEDVGEPVGPTDLFRQIPKI